MKRRYFARSGRRSAARRVLLALLAGILVLVAVAAGAMALRGREIARQVIAAVAEHAGIPPDQLEVRRIGFDGLSLGTVRVGGPEGPAASVVEIGWTPESLLRGRVQRVRVDGLTVNATIAQGEITVAGLPRGEGGVGLVALPVEQIELNDAKVALMAGSASIKATVNATLAPLDSGAIVGRAAIDAFVQLDKSAAVHAVADLPEWRLTADDAGLQFAIAGADLALPDHGVAASAIDARIETGPRLSAQLTAALRDEASPARIAPLAVALEAHGEPDALVVTGRAATADQGISASFAGRHVLSSGRGTVDVTVTPMKFAADGRQPADLFPVARDLVRKVEGTVSVRGAAAWGAVLTSNATVTFDRVGFESVVARISDLSATVRLASLMPPRTAAAQRISANVHAAGLPPMPLDLRFSLPGDHRLLVNAATLGFAGGTLGVADVALAPGKAVDTELTVRAVDLGAVLALLDIDGLSGSGTIEGAIPFRVDASGAALKSGQLVGTVPGVMRYAGTGLPEPAPDAPATDPIRLMRAALADFHYTGLTLTLERAASGEGSLLVHLKGANPQVLDNHPFVFNIRLDANFDKIAAILLDGYAAAEDLIRRGGRP
jgi:hypothetical protein